MQVLGKVILNLLIILSAVVATRYLIDSELLESYYLKRFNATYTINQNDEFKFKYERHYNKYKNEEYEEPYR